MKVLVDLGDLIEVLEEKAALEELVENGVHCARCGELCFEGELVGDICESCMAEEIESVLGTLLEIVEGLELERRKEEEESLEATASMLKLFNALKDDSPIDIRFL